MGEGGSGREILQDVILVRLTLIETGASKNSWKDQRAKKTVISQQEISHKTNMVAG